MHVTNKISLVLLLLVACQPSAAQTPANTTDSTTALTPPPTTPYQQRTMCPRMTVNGQQIPVSPPITVALNFNSTASGACQDYGGAGGIGWGGALGLIFIGGSMGPNCPSERPYLQSFFESWGGSFFWVGAGGAASITDNVCCSFPSPPVMSLQAGYKTGAGGYDYWQNSCDQ